jgi:hypothetical protein
VDIVKALSLIREVIDDLEDLINIVSLYDQERLLRDIADLENVLTFFERNEEVM